MRKEEKIANYIGNIGFCAMFLAFWFEKTLAIFMTGMGMLIFCILWIVEIKAKEKKQ